MQNHNPQEQNLNDFTVSKSMLPKHVLFLYALYICLLMMQATQNNRAMVHPTPDLPKVQSPYFFKDVMIMSHRKFLCSNAVTWPLEDGAKVTSD
jgi:hypothetical protein